MPVYLYKCPQGCEEECLMSFREKDEREAAMVCAAHGLPLERNFAAETPAFVGIAHEHLPPAERHARAKRRSTEHAKKHIRPIKLEKEMQALGKLI